MKKSGFLTLIAIMALSSGLQAQNQNQTRKDRLKDHVYYFASDSLQGRKAGSEYAAKAASYIVKEFESMGLEPMFGTGPVVEFERQDSRFRNVVFKMEGSDPLLKDEYIVLGAHYDHLGVRNGQVYNGADDNASGTAALIEVARELKSNPGGLKRTVVFAAFDAEELGLFGSYNLASMMSDSLGIDKVKLMMSLDMVGWYAQSGALHLEGAATVRGGRKLLESEAEKAGVNVKLKNFETSLFTATDTFGFAEKNVPTFDVTTGIKSPYHKPEDDADLIDYDGMDKVCTYVAALTLAAASDPPFAGTGRIAAKHMEHGRTFEMGVEGSIGGSRMMFSQGGLQGTRPAFSYAAGLVSRINFGPSKMLGLQLGALFESQQTMYPDFDDLFGHSFKYGQKALTVPALFLLQTEGPVRVYLGAGGYYSHILSGGIKEFNGSMAPSANQGGLAFTAGLKIGPVQLSCDVRRQLGPVFSGQSASKAGLNLCCFSLGYFFL